MSDIVIYSSRLCPFCYRAAALLRRKGFTFREINVDMKPALRAEMRGKAGGRNTVPQIFINERHIGGCDELYALDGQGGLDAIVNQNTA